MGRRKLTDMVVLNVNVPRGHDAYWKLIRQLDLAGSWNLRMLDQASNVDGTTIRDFVRRLVRGGFAEVVGTLPQTQPGGGMANQFRLLKAPVETPHLDRRGNAMDESMAATLWRTMRMIKTFTAPDLAALASSDQRTITAARAQVYLYDLEKAGIVGPAREKIRGAPNLYRLIRNLGPKAPSVMKCRLVFDPNQGAVVGIPDAEVAL